MNHFSTQLRAVAIAVATAMASGAAIAAETAADEKDDDKVVALERIEVTARRVVENLQQVPVAVTSMSEDELERQGIETVVELQKISPNTTLQVSRGTNTTLTAFIRGVGQQDPLWGYEPGVGIYIDDVYIARPQGAVLDVFDVGRVEVLRGPQGTLYGKNTIGGAMKYVTKEMSGDAELKAGATLGSHGQRDLKLAGQLPLVEDKVFLGGAVASFQRDGFGTFLTSGEDNYHKDVTAGRLSLEYHVSDDLRWKLVADKTQDDSNAKGGHRLTNNPFTDAPPPKDVYDSEAGMPTDNEVSSEGVALTVSWDVNNLWAFKSITARREGDTTTNIDFDNLPEPYMDVFAVYDDEQLTQELQLSYQGDALSAVMGLYYFDGEACGRYDLQMVALGVSTSTGGCVDTDSKAVYAQGSYQFDERWSMTLGGRYTRDNKEALVQAYTYLGLDTSADPIAVVSDFTNEDTFSHFSPRIGVEYQASNDLMLYSSYSQGFKSGGFNMRAKQDVDPQGAHLPFKEEIVNTYELGFKSELWQQRLRLNGALFYSDYQDMQVTSTSLRDKDGDGALDTPVQVVVNAGEATIRGVELEAQAVLSDALSLTMNLGYLDAQFDEFTGIDPLTGQPANFADTKKISNTPELSAYLAANYETRLGDYGDLVVTASASHRGESYIFEEPSALDEDSYTLMDLSLMFYADSGDWTLGLHGKNLTDKQVRLAGYNFPAPYFADSVIGYYNDPRTVSLSLNYQF